MFPISRFAMSVAAALTAGVPTLAVAAPTDFDLPAQPLQQAVEQVARVGGISVTVDAALVAGRTAPALKGRMEPDEALRRVLAGSGLVVRMQGTSAIITATDRVLSEVRVVGARPADGSAAAGYRVETTKTAGPLGERSLQDTPFSINVMPAELLENFQASSSDDVFRLNPVIRNFTLGTRGAGGTPNPILRGFSLANSSGRAEDGVHAQVMSSSLEDKERIEVLTGLSGFLYGSGNVGGMLNYVTKRPTATPLASITVGNYGGASYYAHADLGGPVDAEGRFAYRLNLLKQDGDTSIDEQSIKRELVSGALDWRLTPDAVVQFQASHETSRIDGAAPFWNFSTNPDGSSAVRHPSAPDAEKNFSQPFAVGTLKTDKVGVGLQWKLNEAISFRSFFRYAEDTQGSFDDVFVNNNVTNSSGTYSQSSTRNIPFYYKSNGLYALFDIRFKTGGISHTVTTGFFGDRLRGYRNAGAAQSAAPALTNLSFLTPRYIDRPAFATAANTPVILTSVTTGKNWLIADDIRLGERWNLLVGLNRSVVQAANFNTTTGGPVTNTLTGAPLPAYDESRTTPSVSLLFKPEPWLTTYASYMEALEQGQIVTDTATQKFTNNGAVLAPFTSKQYELGVKATVGEALLTAAVFQINRALQYTISSSPGLSTVVQSGRQVNKGLEFTVTGRVTRSLSLYGGFTILDPEITRNEANPLLNGKEPTTTSKQMVKLYADYDVPGVPGLTFNGGFSYTGKFAVDNLNTEYLPGFTVYDAGVRYRTRFGENDLILRLGISNLTNKSYWLTGAYVGYPRNVALSAQMKF